MGQFSCRVGGGSRYALRNSIDQRGREQEIERGGAYRRFALMTERGCNGFEFPGNAWRSNTQLTSARKVAAEIMRSFVMYPLFYKPFSFRALKPM